MFHVVFVYVKNIKNPAEIIIQLSSKLYILILFNRSNLYLKKKNKQFNQNYIYSLRNNGLPVLFVIIYKNIRLKIVHTNEPNRSAIK